MTNKKIMIVSTANNREKAKLLKMELEKRGACDVADIHTASPQKLLEELIIKKGLDEEYDYRAFIVDEAIETPSFTLCYDLRRNFPKAHLILWTRGSERPKNTDQVRSNMFHYHYKPGMTIQQVIEEYKHFWHKDSPGKPWQEPPYDKDRYYHQYKYEFERAINVERLLFDVNYIMENWKGKIHYGTAARKVKHILTTGIFDNKLKVYSSLEEERKIKSKNAFKNIIEPDVTRLPNSNYMLNNRPVSVSTFKLRLGMYDKAITEPEHAASIVAQLRRYEAEAKKEVEGIQKIVRGFEDRFPSVVEDPSAYEVLEVGEQEKREGEEGKK